jgi:hypothetical protein
MHGETVLVHRQHDAAALGAAPQGVGELAFGLRRAGLDLQRGRREQV